jgi:hypothetical protein
VAKKPKAHKPFNYLEDMKSKYYVYVDTDGKIACSISRYENDAHFIRCAGDRMPDTQFIRCEDAKDIQRNLRDLKEKHKDEMQRKHFQKEFEKTVGPLTLAMFNNKPVDCSCSLETYWRLGRCMCKTLFPKI